MTRWHPAWDVALMLLALAVVMQGISMLQNWREKRNERTQ
jgi:hypothetical protein